MKVYQAVNDWFQPLPVKPFTMERDAVAHVKAVQETNDGVFHVIELNVTSTVQQVRDPAVELCPKCGEPRKDSCPHPGCPDNG